MDGLTRNQPPELSVVIPTFNEALVIKRTLDAVLSMPGRVEVIVVDGGSIDGTLEILRDRSDLTLVTSRRGRGAQMHAGACVAGGNALWFLHADTLPPADGTERIVEALRDPKVVAGNFQLRFEGTGSAARFLTWLYPHLRKLGLVYGDSGIFVRRGTYEQIGGFQPFPVFEDLDLVRRLRKCGRLVHLPETIETSSRRFEGKSFALTFVSWVFLQFLFWVGVPQSILGRLYAPVRSAGQKSRRDLSSKEVRSGMGSSQKHLVQGKS